MTWRWRINNYLICNLLGACYYDRKTIYINHRIHRLYRLPLLDTCIHKDLHRVFPRAERDIEALTDDILALLTPRDRRLLTARYRTKLGI